MYRGVKCKQWEKDLPGDSALPGSIAPSLAACLEAVLAATVSVCTGRGESLSGLKILTHS